MTSGSQPSSALDDLMLAYTDLSGNSKKSGFKGPPVKDIRREAPKQVFQHSNKARDWRAFDQSLESVFGSSSAPAPAPSLVQAPAPSLVQAPAQAPVLVSAPVSGEGEEWGDFQQFSSSQSQSVGCRLATFQDESPVHRFKAAQPQPASLVSNIAGLRPQPQSSSQPASLLDNDDDFGDFAGPAIRSSPVPALPPTNTVLPTSPVSQLSWNFPTNSSAALKKLPTMLPLVSPAPAGQPQPGVSSSQSSQPPLLVSSGDKYSSLSGQPPTLVSSDKYSSLSVQPPPPVSGSDRYSALRDLLGEDIQPPPPQPLPVLTSPVTCDDDADFGDFAEFTSSTVTSPTLAPAALPASLKPLQTNLNSLFSSLPTEIPSTSTSSNMFASDKEKEISQPEQSEEFDMWSLPPGQYVAPTPSQIPAVRPNQNPLPFLSSSPPPPPPILSDAFKDEELNVEDFSLPSEQFGFSEQEVFGIKKQKVKEAKKPQSIQDVLSLSKESKPLESHNNIPVTVNAHKNIDVETIADDNKTQNSAPSNPTEVVSPPTISEPEKVRDPSPYHEWLMILTEVRSLFDSVLDKFNDIFNEDLKEAVLSTAQGKAYLENFTLVFRVYQRIVRSYQLRVTEESSKSEFVTKINQLMADIELRWRSMEEHCRLYSPLRKEEEEDVGDGGVCGVCLCGGAGLLYNSSLYHPACANFWVNFVTDVLPALAA